MDPRGQGNGRGAGQQKEKETAGAFVMECQRQTPPALVWKKPRPDVPAVLNGCGPFGSGVTEPQSPHGKKQGERAALQSRRKCVWRAGVRDTQFVRTASVASAFWSVKWELWHVGPERL